MADNALDDLHALASRVCLRVEEWLRELSVPEPFFCDKEGLNDELNAAMASAEKKDRKGLTKTFEARRKELEARMNDVAAEELPAIGASLMSLLQELQPLLQRCEVCCQRERAALVELSDAERLQRCRVFYDGTSDDVYSNFKRFRFSVGPVGFMKGEQFFHVAKALLCADLPSAQRMMLTTGGPALRRLGGQVEGYFERGTAWENVDSGLLLLVNVINKLAAVQPAYEEQNARLLAELLDDGRASPALHIAEGAKDDVRCGLGVHADDTSVLDPETITGRWGRNQLGHACMIVARGLARA